MRRATTPMGPAWDWWRDALAGKDVVYHDADPHPGFYRCRLVKRGPWVPAKIWWHSICDLRTGELVEPERLMCLINQRARDPFSSWTWLSRNPITREDYDEMIRIIRWAGTSDPTHPSLNAEQPIDLTRRISTPCPTTR